MESKKIVFRETAIIALGQLVCTGLMFAVFALLGKFDRSVLLGGVIGSVMTVANFFFMAVSTSIAADQAQEQDVARGKATVKISFLLRHIILFIVLLAAAKSGLCNTIALIVPLVFVRPIITLGEFFRK